MARGRGRYLNKFRRLRERSTKYKLRYKLRKSGKPLFIVRRSLRYVYVSLALPDVGGDKTLFTISSKRLLKYGFYGLKNLPAAYLTGYIAGKEAIKRGVNEAIINLGYAWTKKASIPFAAAMGARDAGLNIPIGEEKMVDWDRIRGKHIAEYSVMLKNEDPEMFRRRFSKYLSMGVDPSMIPDLFDKALNMIRSEYGDGHG